MTDFKDYFSTKSDSYAHYRPTYPHVLAEQLATLCKEKNIALDCGCGSGQFSLLLANYFEKIMATDASSNQIESATPHPKITYKVAPAEEVPLPNNSVDIITVAQAAHWLDLEKFYAEAKRVLKPKGIIALITYQNSILNDQKSNHLIENFYGKTLDHYWPPERRLVESGYKTLPFPFPEIEFTAPAMIAEWDFHQLYGYFTTWSAFKSFEAAGGAGEIEKFKMELAAAWGDLETTKTITWPLALRVGYFD
ncbi:MAG: class I SAM-dependent methyltransferase [Gammaproteobacteria bacterium]|nr:MAG: class I SAM-dependent methyltransferase [Gammaproteobacteria bacterium]